MNQVDLLLGDIDLPVYRFVPQPDITAYELALILAASPITCPPEGTERHFVEEKSHAMQEEGQRA